MPLEDDLDVLYACPLGEFIDRRKALVQALRKAGRKEDAAKVAGAAKPTPAAWAVNQLARSRPEDLAAVIEIGDRWRARMLATSPGHADANAMSEARSAQRNLVARLTRVAGQLLEAAGASSSSTTLERVAATLTTISTTGAWGGCPAGQLTRELDPPGFEVLAALVGGTTHEVAPVATPLATGAGLKESVPPEEDAQELQKAKEEEIARRAAAEAQERIERAEAALRTASRNEEQARAEAETVRASLALATSQREQREITAREARGLAMAQEQAAEEARRKAEVAALAARNAEEEAAGAARQELAAKAGLAEAEKAVARAAAECIAAEEALVRERRGVKGPPK